MTKTILIVQTVNPEEGGKFQYSLSIIDALSKLQKKDYDIKLIYTNTLFEPYIPDLIKKKIYCRVSIVSKILRKIFTVLPFGLFIWRILGIYCYNLFRIISKSKPDLVIFPGGDQYSYETKHNSIVPIFDLMHKYENFPEVSEGKINRLRDKKYKSICKYSKCILVDSEMGKTHVIDNYTVDPSRIFVLPYVVPQYVYTTNSLDIKKKYSLPDKYIFYPAQFWEHKNHLAILRAINLLNQQSLTINAVFVGAKKNYYSHICQEIKKLNLERQIWILDYVSNQELISLYKSALALVMPTFFGPTNIPPLEAFALGCPVITSNIYGIPEQVGDAAILVDPTDIDSIASNISLLYNDEAKRQELIKLGFQHNKYWNPDHFINSLHKIISKSSC